MPAQMTPTAWGQGAKNALIVSIAMLVVWCIITAAVVLIFEQPAMAQDRLVSLGERCHVIDSAKGLLFVVPRGVACCT